MAMKKETRLYGTIWRWHFYAGLMVMPFILILSVSGAVYLFKPQIDHWQERPFRNLPTAHRVSADVQVAQAIAANPGAKLLSYRLPEAAGDAALVHLDFGQGQMRDVFVAPEGQVVGSMDPGSWIIQTVRNIHGQLLLGARGSWVVEFAASWTIVLILSGLYLWWPRGRGLAGVLWPRFGGGGHSFWRDLHAVTGFWVSGLALVLLVSGLPWTSFWGSAFQTINSELGTLKGAPDWTIGGLHLEHDHMEMMAGSLPQVPLETIVTKARQAGLAFPVLIKPEAAKGQWLAASDAQNRTVRATVTYDAASGRELSRQDFSDLSAVDRIVAYGVSWHEGQLFGWVNQLIGVLTAAALITLTVSGFVLWRRRKPVGVLGAPPAPKYPAKLKGVAIIFVALAVLLPMLAFSAIAFLLFETVVLRRAPKLRNWLGLRPGPHRSP